MASRDDGSEDKKSWKKLEFYDLLRLLQPMEAKWEGLGYLLVKDYEIQAIKANSFHSNASNQAMFEAVRKWTGRTVREHRKWRTLLHVAKKWGDNTLSQFLMDNNLNEDDDPDIIDIMKWTNQSPLRAYDWYGMAVELIGHNETNAIQASHSGGGNRACLQRLLSIWWNRSTEANRNWQIIVDALKQIDGSVRVIESITDNCSG